MNIYGLIGFPLSHSFSKNYFEEKFLREGITGCAFLNFPLQNINQLPQLLGKHPHLLGFAVTIPHKKKIIPFLDDCTDAVSTIGACNCVKVKEGKLKGYNTDVIGFETSFKKNLEPHHRKALVLGTGGAADAVAFALKNLGLEFLFVSRTKSGKNIISYEDLSKEIMLQHQVIINCTPVGTYPGTGEKPGIPYQFLNADHYLFDLVYNPPKTLFLREGENRGARIQNGYEMLMIQAEENWKIWNNPDKF